MESIEILHFMQANNLAECVVIREMHNSGDPVVKSAYGCSEIKDNHIQRANQLAGEQIAKLLSDPAYIEYSMESCVQVSNIRNVNSCDDYSVCVEIADGRCCDEIYGVEIIIVSCDDFE